MATQMTARIPARPETHADLKAEIQRRDVDTFDELLCELLEQGRSDAASANS